MKVAVLAGGTGGAKLAVGFARALPPEDLSIIANTGDDVTVWGVHVSPDVDAIVYRLAGLFDEARGWGLSGETWAALEMMGRLGEPTWFQLGDRDLAVHTLRTRLEHEGLRPTEAAVEVQRRLGLAIRVLPASDQPVSVCLRTDAGTFTLQEYLVRERAGPEVRGVEIVAEGGPSPEVAAALDEADLVVIGPSNPLISINPILAVATPPRAKTVAVSPIVGGEALKGPTVKMLRELGREPLPETVAEEYRTVASRFVLDQQDATRAEAIEALGYVVQVTDTVMPDGAAARRLAEAILAG
ncbi:MAG TPA: 2-phospho-L-lactate transferase CofD family protein [Candidatus Dormibacteraeota bacterium]